MKVCSVCGYAQQEATAFCPGCGRAMRADASPSGIVVGVPTSKPETMLPANVGAAPSSRPSQPGAATRAPRNGRIGWTGLVAIAGFLVLTVLGMWGMVGGGASS